MCECIFCRIANGEIPSNKAYEDETLFAFHDIEPQAPLHILIVPKLHYDNIQDASSADSALISHMIDVAGKLAKQLGVSDSGFRIVINTGRDGGQSVQHLHLHLLAGRTFGWPPG
ncbi:MAG: histidine triad nucleotide-binding protein [Clostridia bacterium]